MKLNLFAQRIFIGAALFSVTIIAPAQMLINGAGGGQQQIIAQTVDFGASDGPMTDEKLAGAPGKILHVPTVAGAVVVTYNLSGSPKLKLDGPTLADIFLGKITKWNDKRIAALNTGGKLPNDDLVIVHRSDGSGTSYIFTDFLSS